LRTGGEDAVVVAVAVVDKVVYWRFEITVFVMIWDGGHNFSAKRALPREDGRA